MLDLDAALARFAAEEPDKAEVVRLRYFAGLTLAGWMHRAGLGDAPRTLVEEFARIKSGDVVLPTVAERNQPARTLRLRCVTEPDAAQKALLSRLGLNLPRRLRPLDALTDAAQM